MAVLHHLAVTPAQTEVWRQFVAALAAGDLVILLDRAVLGAAAVVQALADAVACQTAALRVPGIELTHAAVARLPVGVEAISDEQWWAFIVSHDVLLEWN